MIYRLTGKLIEKTVENAVLDVNGMAFILAVPQTVSGMLPEIGDEATLYTYLSVKEDARDLDGFADRDEQRCFKSLLSVSGVGPKAGLAILSVLSPAQVAAAVAGGDYKRFTAANGIGPKVAQRIVLELKNKFKDSNFGAGTAVTAGAAGGEPGKINQAISALVALGYTQVQSAKAVACLDPTLSVQELIKQSLRLIAGGKI